MKRGFSEGPEAERAGRRLPRVLAYHKVTGFELGGTWVGPDRFVRQMDAILEAGFRFIDETLFLEALDGGRQCTGREILLTFDDGYRGLIDRAIPALEARGIGALIFLVSAFIGKWNEWELNLPGRRFRHLGWDEIEDLARAGFSFGSHARTHRDLTRLSPEALRDELVRSREEIESRLGAPVRSLSYPYGRASGAVRREAELAGYRAAFTLCPPRSARAGDRYALRREAVYVIDSFACIKAKLGDGLPFAFEDFKGRMINSLAVLTPLLKGGFYRESTTSRRFPRDS
jgi:peptidoglycan/xylan/chitin deacetylase (PgdA/CDA1 family)